MVTLVLVTEVVTPVTVRTGSSWRVTEPDFVGSCVLVALMMADVPVLGAV
jgi:hypothetical protein